MKDKIFLDTNILLYAYSTEKNKQEIAQNILNTYKNIYISKQVINETVNILNLKDINIKDTYSFNKEVKKLNGTLFHFRKWDFSQHLLCKVSL